MKTRSRLAADRIPKARLSAGDEHQPVLSVRNVTVRFDGLVALDRVDLDLNAGEVLGLVGDNGAGKSTLLGVMSGNLRPSSGEVLVDGKGVRFEKPANATAAGIATVYQDLAIALDLDVTANMFLGRERFTQRSLGRLLRVLDDRGMRAETRQALDRLHVRIADLGRQCSGLSGGQRQAVAIARAVTWCDRVLLLDEPTAALGVEQQDEVLNTIRQVKATGIGTVFVSHQLSHVLDVTDRIAVLRKGRIAAVIPTAEATVEELVALITGLDPGNGHAGDSAEVARS
jgi:ABC-type sugar transport system ATPase subunit